MTLIQFIVAFSLMFLAGHSLLNRMKFNSSILEKISLSAIVGLGLVTFNLILLDFLQIPVTYLSALIILFLTTVGLNINQINNPKGIFKFSSDIKEEGFRSYEIYFIAGILILLAASAWRCYYQPVVPFDSKVGIDLVAKYAAKESAISCSVYTQLSQIHGLGNQTIFAPFTMLMQTMFRIIGFSFGKVWLSLFFLSFLTFIYSRLRKVVHPYLAGLILLLFLFSPELYSYSFLVQTDLSNAMFFGIGVIFFYDYYKTKTNRYLWLSTLFMTFACWTRTETIFFIPFGGLILLWTHYADLNNVNIWFKTILFGLFPFLTIVIWNFFFVKFWIPADPGTIDKINLDITNYFQQLSDNIKQMNDQVTFRNRLWNYFVWTSIVIAGVSVVVLRSLKGTMFLLWALIVYFTLILIKTHVSDVSIANTLRRGFFKLFPILTMFIAHSELFQKLSRAISNWEHK